MANSRSARSVSLTPAAAASAWACACSAAVAAKRAVFALLVAAVAADNGLDLQVVAGANIAKLESRQIRGVISGSGDNR